MVVTKAVIGGVSTCRSVIDETGKALIGIGFDVCGTSDGTSFGLSIEVIVDPADSSAVIRQKMLDNVILAIGQSTGLTITNEDVVLPSYSTGLATQASETRSDIFTAEDFGQTVDTSLRPLSTFSISVEGIGGIPISWDIRLEGSLDGINWTEILRHTHIVGNGLTMYSGSNRNPCLYFRSNCVNMSLGTATAAKATILGI